MNERIKELADRASDKWVGGEFFDRNKFAELIIRECANIAFDHWCDGTNEESAEMSILKHFGVK